MRNTLAILTLLIGFFFSFGNVHALSFSDDTVFIDSKNENECTSLGGNFTEWYGEIYCTTSPSLLLSQKEQEIIGKAGEKLVLFIEKQPQLENRVLEILHKYSNKFRNKKNIKRLVIIEALSFYIRKNFSREFRSCSVRFDGCNDCFIEKDGTMSCTEKACLEISEPFCKEKTKRIKVADHTEECVGVSVQQCLLVKEISQYKRELFYDSIEGFDYIEGYEWILDIKENHLDPSTVPADSSSIKRTLQDVVSITKEIDKDCELWFDGCNECMKDNSNNEYSCTSKSCDTVLMPYCLDSNSDNEEAKKYNEKISQ